jgi:glycosyltransferase involved in cell wall biosynthesis
MDCLAVITSKPGMMQSQGMDLLECRHIAFPVFGGTRYPWLRKLANGLALARVATRTILEIRRQRMEAVITILQGRYYFAAALASWLTATPHITIVHDTFASSNVGHLTFLMTLRRRLTITTLQRAAHIYVVSPEMQRLVFGESGRESEIQLPSTTIPIRKAEGQVYVTGLGGPVILFAGTVGYTVTDSLDLLAKLIVTDQLKEYGMAGAQLHLCATMTAAEMRNHGWNHPAIVAKGWVSQSELARELSSADILFLPYSFSKTSRDAVETAFPSKTADYLAGGKPILVFGPKNSSLVRYASDQGFAEIVYEFNGAALARGIRKIASSPSYGKRLADRALEVFSSNHDIKCQRNKFYLTLGRIICASGKVKPFEIHR